MRFELTTSGQNLSARALPLSYTRLHPSLAHRGMHASNQGKRAPGRNSRASPADNALHDEFCLPTSQKRRQVWMWLTSWYRRQDSNLHLPRSKRGARLPLSYGGKKLVGPAGIEPAWYGLKVRCLATRPRTLMIRQVWRSCRPPAYCIGCSPRCAAPSNVRNNHAGTRRNRPLRIQHFLHALA